MPVKEKNRQRTLRRRQQGIQGPALPGCRQAINSMHEKGNEAFKGQRYPDAVKHYTEALRRGPPSVNPEAHKLHRAPCVCTCYMTCMKLNQWMDVCQSAYIAAVSPLLRLLCKSLDLCLLCKSLDLCLLCKLLDLCPLCKLLDLPLLCKLHAIAELTECSSPLSPTSSHLPAVAFCRITRMLGS
eukprot:scaffold99464_cov20-Tisochrysis_lutea.AAC.6